MDIKPFDIYYRHNNSIETATIQPCCTEDNVVDYAVWQNGKLSFTITRDSDDKDFWKVALKNSDDSFDEELVQNIGASIHQHEINK